MTPKSSSSASRSPRRETTCARSCGVAICTRRCIISDMLRALHEPFTTFLWRTCTPILLGVLVLGSVGMSLAHPEAQTIEIAGVFVVFGAVVVVAGRRFSEVWLDGDILEVRGNGTLRVPLAEVTAVELVRGKQSCIRLRFRHQPPVLFIPANANMGG